MKWLTILKFNRDTESGLVVWFLSFRTSLWKPILNKFHKREEVPATTKLSDIISKDLKKRGFKFVGSTVVYAYMQAVGMVNDHTTNCFKYPTEWKF